MKVAVTGAGGNTGGHVFRKLLGRKDVFNKVVGVVRTPESGETLKKSIPEADHGSVRVCDFNKLAEDFKGLDALIIATSAKPAPTGEINPETNRPVFGFPNGEPKVADWESQKQQIDAAIQAGIKHIVICGSMGGTNANHPLNMLGKKADGTGGDILKWKRKAEKYLIDLAEEKGDALSFTIVHPGGLLDEPGSQRALVVDIDDKLLEQENRTVPREDVAEVLIQALLCPSGANRALDLVSKPVSDGTVTTDFEALFASVGGSCDYSKGEIP